MSRSKELILLAQRIRALSQTGLVYSLSEYDTERYEELSRLSDEITALATGSPMMWRVVTARPKSM